MLSLTDFNSTAAVSFKRNDRPYQPNPLLRHYSLPAACVYTVTPTAYYHVVQNPYLYQQDVAAILTNEIFVDDKVRCMCKTNMDVGLEYKRIYQN